MTTAIALPTDEAFPVCALPPMVHKSLVSQAISHAKHAAFADKQLRQGETRDVFMHESGQRVREATSAAGKKWMTWVYNWMAGSARKGYDA